MRWIFLSGRWNLVNAAGTHTKKGGLETSLRGSFSVGPLRREGRQLGHSRHVRGGRIGERIHLFLWGCTFATKPGLMRRRFSDSVGTTLSLQCGWEDGMQRSR